MKKTKKQTVSENTIEMLGRIVNSENISLKITQAKYIAISVNVVAIQDSKLARKLARLKTILEQSEKIACEISHECYMAESCMSDYYRHENFLSDKNKVCEILLKIGIEYDSFTESPECVICMDVFAEHEKKMLTFFNNKYLQGNEG